MNEGQRRTFDIDDALRLLARSDRQTIVPARVHASVMEAWDSAPAPRGAKRMPLWRTLIFTCATVAASAAALVAVYPRQPAAQPPDRAGSGSGGVVLVADPLLDASAATVVRVRVPRRALVSLGIPLTEPDAGGSVDLEMLVGEDGVARTIRRAVAVAGAPQE